MFHAPGACADPHLRISRCRADPRPRITRRRPGARDPSSPESSRILARLLEPFALPPHLGLEDLWERPPSSQFRRTEPFVNARYSSRATVTSALQNDAWAARSPPVDGCSSTARLFEGEVRPLASTLPMRPARASCSRRFSSRRPCGCPVCSWSLTLPPATLRVRGPWPI